MSLNPKSHLPLAHSRSAVRGPADKFRMNNRPKRELMICLGWLKLFDVIVAGR
jgi:hypothetical protein